MWAERSKAESEALKLREALRKLADTNYEQCPNSDLEMKWVCLECVGNWTDTFEECRNNHSEGCVVAEAERLLAGEKVKE